MNSPGNKGVWIWKENCSPEFLQEMVLDETIDWKIFDKAFDKNGRPIKCNALCVCVTEPIDSRLLSACGEYYKADVTNQCPEESFFAIQRKYKFPVKNRFNL